MSDPEYASLYVSNVPIHKDSRIQIGIIAFSLAGLISIRKDFLYSEVWTITGIILFLLSIGFIGFALDEREKMWKCGHCLKRLRYENIIQDTQLSINSTTNFSKQISTPNSQVGVGMQGGQNITFVSKGISTSHIPGVMARVSAVYQCKSKDCGKSMQWQFDSEVQVWTDPSTGGKSYDVIGGVVLPNQVNNLK